MEDWRCSLGNVAMVEGANPGSSIAYVVLVHVGFVVHEQYHSVITPLLVELVMVFTFRITES